MKNANAKGMEIEYFCVGNFSVLVCCLFISFCFSLSVSDLFLWLLLYLFSLSSSSSLSFSLFFLFSLFPFFNPVIFVSTFFLLSFPLSLLLFEKWFLPLGEVFRPLVVASWAVVMFEEHVCGHSLGGQSHDGIFLELL
jgi:hypothetical protein